jgi:chromosomal replication initiator protein
VIDRIVTSVRDRLGSEEYNRYFASQSRFTIEGDCMDVTVASEFRAGFLERRFGSTLLDSVKDQSAGSLRTIRFVVDRQTFAEPAHAAEAGSPETGSPETASPEDAPSAAAPAARQTPRASRRTGVTTTGGSLRHRLDDFVIGNSNRLAHSAAIRIADEPVQGRCAPLFIHGSCGLGKTHLLQGIAERFARTHPGAQVRYSTGEGFTNEFLAAMRSGNTDSFRKAYRKVDMLCIDDVHFFSAKEATQSELLHTFDTIDFDGARVVLASDEHPREIKRLSDKLISRFLAGMVVKIDTPDADTRVRLVKHVALKRHLPLEDAAAQLIAERSARSVGSLGGFGGSVREIEGLVTQVEAIFRLVPEIASTEGRAGLNLVRRALGLTDSDASTRSGAGPRNRRPVQVREITAEVCRVLRVDVTELLGRGRHARVVLARSVTALLSRRLTTMSFPEIARAMARPNHSTIITACKRMNAEIQTGEPLDPSLDLGAELAGMTLSELCDLIAARIERDADGG